MTHRNQLSAQSRSEPVDHKDFRHRYGSTLHVFLWFIISLATIDLAINILFAYPKDPKTQPTSFQAYFDYGRSTEGQLRRMTRPEKDQTAPITLAGWYNPLQVKEFAPKTLQSSIVTIYGASHSVNLATALGRVSNRFTPRSVGGPGATSNWAYGAYLRDRGGGKSYAVVLSFQSSTLPMITSLSPITWNSDAPKPYTADRFLLDGNKLRVIQPPYTSFDSYVETLDDPQKWSMAREFFSKHDPFYNSWVFRENLLDYSSLFRLVRRAYAQHVVRDIKHSVLDQSGFQPESEPIKVATAIIHEFAIRARRDGSIPVIFMINDLGYSNFLFQALSSAVQADNVPYLSSDAIVPPNDPRGYLPDSHFTIENDDKLARALEGILENGDNAQPLSHQ
ncbi:MAG TPA: hypothetical protein VFA65_04580 [Bryobacteraceae bacterium]|nr:hypothetical protein [Bryobacteraceae bacterium]